MDEVDGTDGVGLTRLVSAWRAQVIDWRLTEAERAALLPDRREGEEPSGETLARIRLLVGIGDRLRPRDGVGRCDWLRRPDLLFALRSPLEVMAGPLEELVRLGSLVERGLGS